MKRSIFYLTLFVFTLYRLYVLHFNGWWWDELNNLTVRALREHITYNSILPKPVAGGYFFWLFIQKMIFIPYLPWHFIPYIQKAIGVISLAVGCIYLKKIAVYYKYSFYYLIPCFIFTSPLIWYYKTIVPDYYVFPFYCIIAYYILTKPRSQLLVNFSFLILGFLLATRPTTNALFISIVMSRLLFFDFKESKNLRELFLQVVIYVLVGCLGMVLAHIDLLIKPDLLVSSKLEGVWGNGFERQYSSFSNLAVRIINYFYINKLSFSLFPIAILFIYIFSKSKKCGFIILLSFGVYTLLLFFTRLSPWHFLLTPYSIFVPYLLLVKDKQWNETRRDWNIHLAVVISVISINIPVSLAQSISLLNLKKFVHDFHNNNHLYANEVNEYIKKMDDDKAPEILTINTRQMSSLNLEYLYTEYFDPFNKDQFDLRRESLASKFRKIIDDGGNFSTELQKGFDKGSLYTPYYSHPSFVFLDYFKKNTNNVLEITKGLSLNNFLKKEKKDIYYILSLEPRGFYKPINSFEVVFSIIFTLNEDRISHDYLKEDRISHDYRFSRFYLTKVTSNDLQKLLKYKRLGSSIGKLRALYFK